MYGAFQSNAFQSNAFQIVTAAGVAPPTPSATPGPGDLEGPSLEWLLYVEEQNRRDEQQAVQDAQTRARVEPQIPTLSSPKEAGSRAPDAHAISAHLLRAAEAKARQIELHEKAKAEQLLLDEMIIVGILSI